MNTEKLKELKSLLEAYAADSVLGEDGDYDPYSASGGNYDDAHSLGVEDGMTIMARKLLEEFF